MRKGGRGKGKCEYILRSDFAIGTGSAISLPSLPRRAPRLSGYGPGAVVSSVVRGVSVAVISKGDPGAADMIYRFFE